MKLFDTVLFAVSWPLAIMGVQLFFPLVITQENVVTAVTAGYCAVGSMWLMDWLGRGLR